MNVYKKTLKLKRYMKEGLSYKQIRKEVMKEFIIFYVNEILKKKDGIINQCAKETGIDRANFKRLMRDFGIENTYRKPTKPGRPFSVNLPPTINPVTGYDWDDEE